jgi:hypothetical protein
VPFAPFRPPPKEWAPPTAGLTHPQLIGIGAVITTWAALEQTLEHLLYELVQAPAVLGQALSEDLNADSRCKALLRLCTSWEHCLQSELASERKSLEQIRSSVQWVRRNRDKRNKFAHYNWLRITDEQMAGFKFSLKPKQTADGPFERVQTVDIEPFANEIATEVDKLFKVLNVVQGFPKWPQAPSKRGG